MLKKIFYWIIGKRRNRVLRDTAMIPKQTKAGIIANEETQIIEMKGDIMQENKTIARVEASTKESNLELNFYNWYDNLEISKRSKLAKALKLKPGDRLEVSFKKIGRAK